MTLPDWSAAAETAVAPILDKWIDYYGLPPELAYAVVSQESRFNPDAVRPEPQINDASYGLTQILLRTAQGLGYTGTAAGLYDPDTNVQFGFRYLFDLLNRYGGNQELAISAYNGGLRGATITNPAYVAGVQARERWFLAQQDTSGGVIVYDSSTASPAGGGWLLLIFLSVAIGNVVTILRRRRR